MSGSSGGKHWSTRVKEATVAAQVQDGFLSLPLKGGADSGTFCVLGEVNHKKVVYWSGKIHADHVILEVQGYKVSGFTLRDVKELIETLSRNTEPLLLKILKPGLLPKDLKTYLSSRFKKGSPDYELQQTIRDNLYLRTVPCTTRAPRAGEVNGVDYTFLSVDEFFALEKSGNLLESGVYEGNHYGTPKPSHDASGLYRKPSGQLVNGPPEDGSSSSAPADPSTAGSSSGGGGGAGTLQRHRNKSKCEAVAAAGASSSSAKSTPAAQRRQADGSESQGPSSVDPEPDAEEPLPFNWEMGTTAEGYKFYIDHNTSTTQWERPRLDGTCNRRSSALMENRISGDPMAEGHLDPLDDDDDLPFGWEKVDDPQYGVFYIDHINKHTQYERPAPAQKGTKKAEPKKPPNENGQGEGLARPIFTADPSQLRGQRVSTTLVKSPRGFGFTIVGGSDRSRPQFLQIKNVVEGGPAATDSILNTGDVLVHVDGTCVLGYTHADMVSMFQRIPVGQNVTLHVCKGYSLPFDPDDPDTEVITTVAVSPASRGPRGPGAPVDAAPAGAGPGEEEAENSLARAVPRPPAPFLSSSPGQRQTSRTSSESISSGLTSNTTSGAANAAVPGGALSNSGSGSGGGGAGPPGSNSGVFFLPRPEHTPRPEFIKASIVKSNTGFGFTIADSPQGQKVKQILDRNRCRTLLEGDLLVEINDQRVKEMAHNEVVQVLKECPINTETRILIQRGGILSAAATSNSVTVTSAVPPSASLLASSFDTKLSVSAMGPAATFLPGGRPPLAGQGLSVTAPHAGVPPPPGLTSVASGGPSPLASFQSRMQEEERRANTLTHTRYRSRTPGPEWGRSNVDMEAAHLPNRPKTPTALELRSAGAGGFGFGDVGTMNYGSLARGSRLAMPSSQSFPSGSDRPASVLLSPAAAAVAAPAPGQEFFAFLRRGATGFGFRIVGGAEEGSQVSIGHIVAAGPAEAEGRLRQGDEIVSVDNVSVLDATHRRVVQLMESASSVGCVALGLRRPRPRYPYDVMVVRRETEGFGFVIVSSANRQGSCIGRLVENSPAERCGQLHIGDRILAVNRVDISTMRHEDVVNIIKESGFQVTLTIGAPLGPTSISAATAAGAPGVSGLRRTSLGGPVMRSSGDYATQGMIRAATQPSGLRAGPGLGMGPQPGEEFEVTLYRGTRGFGFSIRGGQEFNQMPLYVLRIAEGGAAYEDGRLKVGDQILRINGRPTSGMSHSQAIEIIQSGGNMIRLLARRPLTAAANNHVPPPVPSMPAKISYTTDSEMATNPRLSSFPNGSIPQPRSTSFDRPWTNQRQPY